MSTVMADAALICGNDLRLEWRGKVVLTQVTPFVLATVMLFGFALDADSATLRRTSTGLFWVVVVLSAVLVSQRGAAAERNDGLGDALRLTGMSPAGMFLGRFLSLAAQLVVVEVVAALAMVVVFDLSPRGPVLSLTAMVLATAAIAAACALYGPLVAGISARETVLPLLLVPALAPVLLAATRAMEVAQGRGVGDGWSWAGMLLIVTLVYVTMGMAAWGPLLEAT